MRISIIVLALNVVLNVVSFKAIGLLGPALTTLVLTIAMTIALLYFGAKEINSTIIDLFDFKEIAIIGYQICLFGVVSHLLANFLRSSLEIPLFFVLAISYGLYLFALFGLNYKRILHVLRKLNAYK